MKSWNNIKVLSSTDEKVKKYIFTKEDAIAESVLYRYPDHITRTVVCCSVQSGCPVGCKFCGTGNNFIRSLSNNEIESQVTHCLSDTGVNTKNIKKLQIMTMSMGEPMLNQQNIITALSNLHKSYSNADLLVSTVAPNVSFEPFMQLAEKIDKVGLQFSVHESKNRARDLLIPFQNKMTLAEIAMKGEEFFIRTGRHPFFNYCAHPGNTSDKDADILEALFDPHIWRCTISVICEKDEGVKFAQERQMSMVNNFQSKMFSRGFNARTFNPAGQGDIGGGCGQLWFVQQWMKEKEKKKEIKIT